MLIADHCNGHGRAGFLCADEDAFHWPFLNGTDAARKSLSAYLKTDQREKYGDPHETLLSFVGKREHIQAIAGGGIVQIRRDHGRDVARAASAVAGGDREVLLACHGER